MNRRKYQHVVRVSRVRSRRNYFREMLQVANVDPANRKSVTEVRQEVADLSIAFRPYFSTYFWSDVDCLEWIHWLVRNGFAFQYEYSADGFDTSEHRH